MSEPIDLRSDTVTMPTPEMRAAISEAVVGDDGYDEDPTIVELQRVFAELVGKQSALFVPSGVMANQIAIRILTRPGDLVVAGREQHVVGFEEGAAAANASVQFALLDDHSGVLSEEDIAREIEGMHDHRAPIAMGVFENTHMYSGGVPMDVAQTVRLAKVLGDRPLHLDGARLFNASVAVKESLAALAAPATTVSAALSKGLCAPVGSLLAGPEELMRRARIERKRLGGAMRQAGFLAAAGLVGLRTMIPRLVEDHARARQLADAAALRFPESNYDPSMCRTNIVAFNHPRAREIRDQLALQGILSNTLSPGRFRMVTHAGVSQSQTEKACEILARFQWT